MMPVVHRGSLLAVAMLAACVTDPGSVGQFSGGTQGSSADASDASGDVPGGTSTSGGQAADDESAGASTDGAKFDLGTDTGGPVVECGEPEDNPIYVLTRGLENGMPDSIYGFDPESLTFSPVLDVVCPDTGDWGVSSMAIDRQGRAWIEWGAVHEGPEDPHYKRLDTLDLATGDCQPDQGALPTTEHWGTPLGMAFVSASEGSAAEELFFVDTGTWLHGIGTAAPYGQYYAFQTGQGTEFSGVELTGTGEGRLFNLIMNWSFEWDHPCTADDPCYPMVHLGEVDKTDGSAISNVELTEVEAIGISPGGFAFAHWGGHFWIFLSIDYGATRVYDHDPATGTTVVALDDGPDGVVGAGVSTCAPLIFPEG